MQTKPVIVAKGQVKDDSGKTMIFCQIKAHITKFPSHTYIKNLKNLKTFAKCCLQDNKANVAAIKTYFSNLDLRS